MKSKISATIITDSINPQGDRIPTYELVFPRFILAELNTHRMFSKNSASSRAIPFERMLKMVTENPFIPIAWQKNHSGMQGTEYLDSTKLYSLNDFLDVVKNMFQKAKIDTKELILLLLEYGGLKQTLPQWWLLARDLAVKSAIFLYAFGVTKQICNRLLEPFMWHSVLLTATEFENFFNLRCPQYEDPEGNLFKSKKEYHNKSDWKGSELWRKEDWYGCNKSQAEIHMQALAEAMWDAMNESTPTKLKAGEYHIPYGDNVNYEQLGFDTAQYYKDNPNEVVNIDKWVLKVCTARCARLSYQTVGNNPKIDYEADIRLHDMLLKHYHMSPFEHCQRTMTEEEYESFIKGEINPGFDIPKKTQGWCDNMKGFISYRYLLENNLEYSYE